LATREEVDTVITLLSERSIDLKNPIDLWPIYGSMNYETQSMALQQSVGRKRKVVVATDVVETRRAVQGITFVVESGFSRIRFYDTDSKMNVSKIVKVSKATSTLRSRSAGLSRPGKCFHLYSKDEADSSYENSLRESQRLNLASTILRLQEIGIQNVLSYDYVFPPSYQIVQSSLEVNDLKMMSRSFIFWVQLMIQET
jgi:HrpA-like RNA helicase